MLLLCAGLRPFAGALQRESEILLFSWGTSLGYTYSVVVYRDY